MTQKPSEVFDAKQLENVPPLARAEAAWLAGITPDAFERFLLAAGLDKMDAISVMELVRVGFTQLGQREAQLAMFRLQLAAALQREKELTETLHSKLTKGAAALFPASTGAPVTPPPVHAVARASEKKSSKKRKKKK